MDVIKFSIKNPVGVLVGVILVVMFGLVALNRIPYQLSPSVKQPVVTVNTTWPGATPYEIERDIVEEQEAVLKGLPNLEKMDSTSSNSSSRVTLTFDVGTDIEQAILRVSNKLDEVRVYPENVERPVISASGENSSPIVFLGLRTVEGNDRHIFTYLTFFENEIRQFLERVDGVGEVRVFGGSRREMHILLDPEKLASYQLTVSDVVAALRDENVNMSAGNLDVGRFEHRIRAVAEFRSPDDIENTIIVTDGQRRIRVADLATVEYGYQKLDTPGLQNGHPGIVAFIVPEPEANVLDVTDRIEEVVNGLNENRLAAEGLRFHWLGDERPYIKGAIRLLRQNILIGGVLAIIVLLLFLRSIASTVIVATAIPISIIGSFIFMGFLGTTLNVVSLAGIAFAVGMLVDNAIVVLENIDRHRRMGKSPFQSAYDGAREVWGAVLASSLTTIAVFVPIVFLELEVGLLFRDIAVAVTSAVMLSLLVSISVIPMFSRRLFDIRIIHHLEEHSTKPGAISRFGERLSDGFMRVIGLALRNAATRILTIAILTVSAFVMVRALLPKMEYLPEGNRDFIFNMMIPPPGLSYAERHEVGQFIKDYLKPYYEPEYEGYPGISHFFYMGSQQFMAFGVVSRDQARTRELIPMCQQLMGAIPGVFGVSTQASIFGRGMGRGRTIDVDFSGRRIEDIIAVADATMGQLRAEIPGVQIRPVPSLDMLYPEARYVPDSESLRAVGMSAQQFGLALDVLMDGRDIGDFKQEGEKKIDLIVKLGNANIDSPQDLHNALIPTPAGKTIPIASLASMQETTGVTEIRHLERNRTVSLQVTPPYSVTIEETMDSIEETIIPQLWADGLMEGITHALSGTADKLSQTRQALQWNFLLAAAITYLLMSALFGNFLYPLVIMFTVPLAGAGGFIGLELVNRFVAPQRFDILTMLGFIILIGVVVNNAILIVHQSLNNVRIGGMEHREAVLEATRSRLRPVYMTAATSIFGMLPLVLLPGPGSELYRGLGSVVLGGLAMSTIFTVFLIPSLLLFFIRMERRPIGL